MPTIDQYSNDAYLRLLLQGPFGVGKTTLACQFPGAWIIDCDLNLGGALRWLKNHNRQLPLGYDVIDRKEDGSVVPPNLRYARVCECVNAAAKRGDVKTFVFDGGSKINEYIKDDVLRRNPTKSGGLEMPSWGFIYSTWLQLVGLVTAAKVNCVFIFHEKDVTNEDGGYIRTGLNVQGQFKDVAGSLFTDVWRCEVSNVGIPPKYTWQIRTMPDHRYQLKNSLELPATFEFNWKTIEDKLNPPAK